MKENVNKLTWGLFHRKPKYWYETLKDIKIIFKRFKFLLKHGYSEIATWNTDLWFINTMREILTCYRYDRDGTPCPIDEDVDIYTKKYNDDLDKMIQLLDKMDKTSEIYIDMNISDIFKSKDIAKDEFFELFSKYFYDLWD